MRTEPILKFYSVKALKDRILIAKIEHVSAAE